MAVSGLITPSKRRPPDMRQPSRVQVRSGYPSAARRRLSVVDLEGNPPMPGVRGNAIPSGNTSGRSLSGYQHPAPFSGAPN